MSTDEPHGPTVCRLIGGVDRHPDLLATPLVRRRSACEDARVDADDADEGLSGEPGGSEEDAAMALPTHVFFENESLIRALNDPRRGENDPALAQLLFASLLRATLIALVPEDQDLGTGGAGEVELDGDLELSFVLVRHPEVTGDIVPTFTDEGALGAFLPEGGRYVALAARDLLPLLGTGTEGPPNIVVNPGGDEALLLTPRMVQDLIDAARGYGTTVVPEDAAVEAGPASEPLGADIGEQVVDVLAGDAHVRRAWQLEWRMEGRHREPALVLAIELDIAVDGSRRLALASLWRRLSPLLRGLERQVELVDADAQRSRIAHVIDAEPPFWTRADA